MIARTENKERGGRERLVQKCEHLQNETLVIIAYLKIQDLKIEILSIIPRTPFLTIVAKINTHK